MDMCVLVVGINSCGFWLETGSQTNLGCTKHSIRLIRLQHTAAIFQQRETTLVAMFKIAQSL